VFWVVGHEKTCVVGDEVVGNLEVFARRFDAGLPSDTVDHQPCTQVFVPPLCQGLKRESFEEAVDVGVLKMPRPPPLLLRRARRGCHRQDHH